MKVRGTDFVHYQVTDMEQSIMFYRDMLGMELEECFGDAWAELNATPTTLALYRPEGSRADSGQRGGGVFIALAVDNVPEAVEELKEKGVVIVKDAIETPVCWFAIIADPDGNLVGLHQRKDGTFG